jgi:hypothetical protein
MLLRPTRHLIPVLLMAVALPAAPAHAAPSTPRPASHSHAPGSKGGIAYRWVDEQGVVHYGDNIPPQYAQQDRAVLNRDGLEVGHLEAAKSPQQAAAEAQAKADALKQRQHDSFLVSTYTSVKDIEALRDVRLDQLQGQRAAAEQYVESLRRAFGTLQVRAVAFQPYAPNARRMPDDLPRTWCARCRGALAERRARGEGPEEKTLRDQFDVHQTLPNCTPSTASSVSFSRVGMSEAAGAAGAGRKILHELKFHLHHRHHDDCGMRSPGLTVKGFALVPAGHQSCPW